MNAVLAAATPTAPSSAPVERVCREAANASERARAYTMHTDGGHAWIEVPVAELRRLDISDKLTSSSYVSHGNAYLEEDVDLSTFVTAKAERSEPVFYVVRSTPGDSFIRSLPRYA